MVQQIGDDRFLMLSAGQRLERVAGNAGSKLSEFQEYGVLIGERARQVDRVIPPRALSTLDLVLGRTPEHAAARAALAAETDL